MSPLHFLFLFTTVGLQRGQDTVKKANLNPSSKQFTSTVMPGWRNCQVWTNCWYLVADTSILIHPTLFCLKLLTVTASWGWLKQSVELLQFNPETFQNLQKAYFLFQNCNMWSYILCLSKVGQFEHWHCVMGAIDSTPMLLLTWCSFLCTLLIWCSLSKMPVSSVHDYTVTMWSLTPNHNDLI